MKAWKKVSLLALSAVLTLGCVACGETPSEQNKEYTDPNTVFTTYDNKLYNEYLMGDDVAISHQWENYGIGDPFVMRYNGKYYLYCSSLNNTDGVRAYVSADLVNWAPVTGNGLPDSYVSVDPITTGAYAPEVYHWNGQFYMYTSPSGSGHHVLVADSPEGPFVKATDNFGLTIDGSVLIDDDESMYFTYANNNGIRMAKMVDMLSVDASATPRLNGTSIGGWTEGSYILKRDGIYYLTYTGNAVTSEGYRIAYSTADNVATSAGLIDNNAFTRAANNPLALNTESALKGIGHSSTVMGPDMDSYYLAYHVLNSLVGPDRSLGIDRLLFNGKMMSVATMLEGSIKPTAPAFYAVGADSEKFDTNGSFLLSKEATKSNFTVEFNLKGNASSTYVFSYVDENNYFDVTVDFDAKKVTLNKTANGTKSEVATGTLVNNFAADKLHTVRVAARDGIVDVVFDNMTKIDNAQVQVNAGKIGYLNVGNASVGYTAFSNVAMGMSDEMEAKQAAAYIGASNYLHEDVYNDAYNLGNKSGISTIETGSLAGTKQLTLGASGDYASYLVNYAEAGRYGVELVYDSKFGGKKIGFRLDDGKIYSVKLPKIAVEDEEDGFVRTVVFEYDVAKAGIHTFSVYGVGDEVSFAAFRGIRTSGVSPSYEQPLNVYADKGVDYKTLWKIKYDGHYAKAGTRQLVYFGDNTITDFTLEVEIMFEGNAGVSTAGIIFHAGNYAASSTDTYKSIQGYYVALNNQYVVLEKLNYIEDSKDLVMSEEENPFEADKFVPLKIQVRGNAIKVWSGESLLIDYVDAWGITSGKIGFYTNGAAIVYRNLKIYA